jgi:nucleotide-binding universal stress UspA family protein
MSNIQSAPAVVVGIDGSKPAIHAALWAIDEAVNRYNAGCSVLTVRCGNL